VTPKAEIQLPRKVSSVMVNPNFSRLRARLLQVRMEKSACKCSLLVLLGLAIRHHLKRKKHIILPCGCPETGEVEAPTVNVPAAPGHGWCRRAAVGD
jgi:hypothetical protein